MMIILNDEYQDKMHSAAAEVKARGAYTIMITNLKKFNREHYDDIIQIPSCGVLSSLLAIIPIQYLSYKISLELNNNPDFPRHLAKSCTTT